MMVFCPVILSSVSLSSLLIGIAVSLVAIVVIYILLEVL